MEHIATPEDLKRSVAMPSAGAHVLGSDLVSKDVDGVYDEIAKFATEILRIKD
jgi:hypothetical protein